MTPAIKLFHKLCVIILWLVSKLNAWQGTPDASYMYDEA